MFKNIIQGVKGVFLAYTRYDVPSSTGSLYPNEITHDRVNFVLPVIDEKFLKRIDAKWKGKKLKTQQNAFSF
jgi:hypothetical protein